LILAGSADLKFELGESDLFDQRLRPKILKYVDIAYGSYAGFNEAINLAIDCLKDVDFVIEKNLLDEYFNHVARETGLYCFGIDETFKALECGAVKTLIIWENLPFMRYTIQYNNKNEEIIYCLPDHLNKKNADTVIFLKIITK
jgi:peptide chain release factor subunit 1